MVAQADRIKVVPNGVDLSIWHDEYPDIRPHLGISSDAIVVGWAGTFAPFHGTEWFARVASRVIKYDPRLWVLMVGDGDCRAATESILKATGRATFTGMVPREDVPRLLSCADFCVIPRFEKFQSPLKFYEFVAAGKPVIAPSHGDVARIMRDNWIGTMFPEDSDDDLICAMLDMAGCREMRDRMGANGRELAVKEFSWKERVRQSLEGVLAW